jgi:hypothetical protein
MKRLIGFLIVAGLVACNCIGQVVKTQTIYAGSSCTAPLPNYTTIVTVSDNCAIKSYTQTPVAGTMLTATNPAITVTLRAEDNAGNVRTKSFQVVLLDTIKPVFNFPAQMLAYTPSQINGMYLAFETSLKETILNYAKNTDWNAEIFVGNHDTLWQIVHPIQVTKEEYQTYLNRQK